MITTTAKSSIKNETSSLSSSSHVSSVIQNKNNNNDISSIKSLSNTNNDIIYAIIESIIVFLGILFIYILIRSSRVSDLSHQLLINDKEELIRNEFITDRRIVHM